MFSLGGLLLLGISHRVYCGGSTCFRVAVLA